MTQYVINGETHDFDEAKMTNVEAMDLEKVTGLTFKEWSEALQAGSMTATTALVWVIQKRKDPKLRFSDVEFPIDGLQVEADDPKDEGSTPTD